MEKIKLLQVADSYHLYDFKADVDEVLGNGYITSVVNCIRLKDTKATLNAGVTCFKLGVLLEESTLELVNPNLKPLYCYRDDTKDVSCTCKLINNNGETELILTLDEEITFDLNEGVTLCHFKSTSHFWDNDDTDRDYGVLIRKHSVKHPYHSVQDDDTVWRNVDAYLEEYRTANIDYNLVVRWDLIPLRFTSYNAIITLWHQRLGTLVQHRIDRVTESDMPKLIDYLETHRGHLDKMWYPVSPNITLPTTFIKVKYPHVQNWCCDVSPSQLIPKGTKVTSWFRGDVDVDVEATLDENLTLDECVGLLESIAKDKLSDLGHLANVNGNYIEGVVNDNGTLRFQIGT